MGLAPPPDLDIEIVELDGEMLALFSWSPRVAGRRTGGVPLTRAEQEVLDGICAGRSNAAIAKARGTAVRTVANQIAALFRKFHVRSRHELVAKLANR
jgi:DNA-binding CsgD family transcriptional regulator